MAIALVNTLLDVDPERFRLRLWQRSLPGYEFKVAKQYEVAIGQDRYPTRRGYSLINNKSRCPEWKMPDSEWVAPELRGKILPCDHPDNPIKARWLGVTNPVHGIGIHGTADDASIGSAASHGCIRMHVPDVVELFDLVKLHTPIFIG